MATYAICRHDCPAAKFVMSAQGTLHGSTPYCASNLVMSARDGPVPFTTPLHMLLHVPCDARATLLHAVADSQAPGRAGEAAGILGGARAAEHAQSAGPGQASHRQREGHARTPACVCALQVRGAGAGCACARAPGAARVGVPHPQPLPLRTSLRAPPAPTAALRFGLRVLGRASTHARAHACTPAAELGSCLCGLARSCARAYLVHLS